MTNLGEFELPPKRAFKDFKPEYIIQEAVVDALQPLDRALKDLFAAKNIYKNGTGSIQQQMDMVKAIEALEEFYG